MPTRPALAALLLIGATCIAAAQGPTQTITVNGRDFTLPAATPVLIDDQPGVLADLLELPPGLQLR